MKKLTKKLAVSTQTIRILNQSDLDRVGGGRDVTRTCPGVCVFETEDCDIIVTSKR